VAELIDSCVKARSSEAKHDEAVLGLRVKSGFAIAVLLAGPVQFPQVLDRCVLDLCDPAVPESRQPYHAAFGTLEEDESKLAWRIKTVKRATNTSVTKLLKDYRKTRWLLRGAALVVGSVIEPASITNPHIRAHALEGQLFRRVLEKTLTSKGLPCSVVVERSAYAKAASVLGRVENDLKRAVVGLGRSRSGPWRAEEKLASLAAWIALD